ncbi:glutamine synthetase family protein [Streptomyces sp. HNM0663]|uniref:Glutamine synthetase family protein n=1 Tax=Streptomyces chengmaiensis TaxID=3040919 RepID=A0ABT6HYC0_9ACTN|nr:glutamine synthetase family protein [Streptomyces chengmaiensis]MDH2393712.1 glutamine synthetase family protein [Streptomyces chengmaiensis]
MSGTGDAYRQVLQKADAHGVELIRFLWVDHNGIVRGKAVTRQYLESRMESGIGLAKSRQAAGLMDIGVPVPGFNAVGEVRLVPDPESFIAFPHAPGSGAMLCDLVQLDDAPWDACPRTFLKSALAAAGELQIVASFEPEFTLCAARPKPGALNVLDDSLCFDNTGFDAANDYVVQLLRGLQGQGIEVEVYHPEFGAGQHEMTLRHGPALRAADISVWQKVITRGLASSMGLWATFAPTPAPGFRGNGNHLHLSMWQDRPGLGKENVFADGADALGLSETAYHFIGGVLRHLPGLLALTCPSVNSYERLQPGMWSGAHACYGQDNREAAVRIPSRLRGAAAASTNVELKAVDSTANPYLAMGAVIYAGMDGVTNRIDPGPQLEEDPNGLSDAERDRLGLGLPQSLEESLEALRRDDYLMDVLGPLRRQVYPAIKEADIRAVKEMGDEIAFLTYTTRY